MEKIEKLSEFKKDLLAVVFLVSFCFLFFIKLFIPESSLFFTPDLGISDAIHGTFSKQKLVGDALKQGKWPIWTNQIGTGESLIAEGQATNYNLVNLTLFYFFSPVIATNLSFFIFLAIAAISTYILAIFLKFDRFISLFVSATFISSGFFIFRISHANLFDAYALLPLIVFFALRIWSSSNYLDALLLVLLISQQIFFGHIQISLLTVLGIILISLYLFFRENRNYSEKTKCLSLILVAILGAFISTSVQLLPQIELKGESVRTEGLPFNLVTSNSLTPKFILTLIYPFLFGNPADGTYPIFKNGEWDIFWEKMGYLGVVTLTFGVIGMFTKGNKTRFSKEIFLLLLLLGLFLALGKYSPLFFVYSLPPFNFFRGAQRALFLVDFSFCFLAGFGLQYVWYRLSGKFNNLFPIQILLLSSIFIPALLITYSYHPVVDANTVLKKPESVNYVKSDSVRVYTLGSGTPYMQQLLRYGWNDSSYYVFAINSLEANVNILYDVAHANSYSGVRTTRQEVMQSLLKNEAIGDLIQYTATSSSLHKKVMSLTNTGYVVSPFKIEDPDLPLRHTVLPPEPSWQPFYIYENLGVLPRARVVSDYLLAKNFDEAVKLLKSDNFDFKNQVIIEGDLGREFDKNMVGKAIITKDDNEVVDIDTDTDKDKESILVLADSYYPGWKAYMDGTQTKIYPANVNQRAIILPEGKHDIKFVYDPDSFKTGKRISIIAWTVWGILFIGALVLKITKKRYV